MIFCRRGAASWARAARVAKTTATQASLSVVAAHDDVDDPSGGIAAVDVWIDGEGFGCVVHFWILAWTSFRTELWRGAVSAELRLGAKTPPDSCLLVHGVIYRTKIPHRPPTSPCVLPINSETLWDAPRPLGATLIRQPTANPHPCVSLYSTASRNASQEASMMLSLTPTVPQMRWPSPLSISTRVREPAPSLLSMMRTL